MGATTTDSVPAQGVIFRWQGPLNFVVLSSIFLYAFEFPVLNLSTAIVPASLGPAFLLLHPAPAILICLVIERVFGGAETEPAGTAAVSRSRYIFVALAAMVLGIWLAFWFGDADLERTLRLIILGIGSIALGALAFSSPKRMRQRLLTLGVGLAAWATIATLLYVRMAYFLWRDFSAYQNYRIGEFLIFARFPGEFIYGAHGYEYFSIVGNINKASNFAILGLIILLLVDALDGPKKRSSRLLLAVPLAFLLLITLSRGALVVSGAIGLGLLVATVLFQRRDTRSNRLRTAIFAMPFLLPSIASVSTGDLRNYWTNLDTMAHRADLWITINEEKIEARLDRMIVANDVGRCDCGLDGFILPSFLVEASTACRATYRTGEPIPLALEAAADCGRTVTATVEENNHQSYLSRLFFGYGPGEYGRQKFQSVNITTHNLFLDAWAEGGMLSGLGLTAAILISILGVARSWMKNPNMPAMCIALGLATICALGFREYSILYLSVANLGGFMLGAFLILSRIGPQGDQASGPADL